jgi:hypothetical protein
MKPVVFILATASLVGCEADITVEDGGSSEGGASSNSATGASSADGGAPPTSHFDALGMCTETCNRPCVGTPSTCIDECLAVTKPNCEVEGLAAFECSMWYCSPDECDQEQLTDAVFSCLNPFYCGHAGNDLVCDQDTTDDCDCTGECDDGYTGRIVCSAEGICDCYFDGELVASCSDESDFGCGFLGSCCEGYMLPGGGPAAGAD